MNLKVYIQEFIIRAYAIFTVIYISKLIANNVICCKCKLFLSLLLLSAIFLRTAKRYSGGTNFGASRFPNLHMDPKYSNREPKSYLKGSYEELQPKM